MSGLSICSSGNCSGNRTRAIPQCRNIAVYLSGAAVRCAYHSLAGASAALPNDGYGVFSNPATIGYVSSQQAVVGYRSDGAGVYGIPLAYLLPGNGKRGLRHQRLWIDQRQYSGDRYRQRRHADNYRRDNAYLNDYALSLSWAKKLGEFSAPG